MDYKNLKSYKAEAGIKVEKQRREQRQQGGAACGGRNFFMKSMKQESELTVITRAKDLCSYIMTITQKSPRHFRYTFVTRLQNLSSPYLRTFSGQMVCLKGKPYSRKKADGIPKMRHVRTEDTRLFFHVGHGAGLHTAEAEALC